MDSVGSRGRGRSAGIRTTSRKELEVPIQLVINGRIVGVGGLEIFPVVLAEEAGVIVELQLKFDVVPKSRWKSGAPSLDGGVDVRDGSDSVAMACLVCNKAPVSIL